MVAGHGMTEPGIMTAMAESIIDIGALAEPKLTSVSRADEPPIRYTRPLPSTFSETTLRPRRLFKGSGHGAGPEPHHFGLQAELSRRR